MPDVTFMQGQVLGAIIAAGNAAVVDVAMHLRISEASARGHIRRLEQRGLVERTYTAGTTHQFLVFASRRGEEVARRLFDTACSECDGYGITDGLEPCSRNCRKGGAV